jgi:parallel beta-helix repeat protein
MQKRFLLGAALGLCIIALVSSSASASGGAVTRVVDEDGKATIANCNDTTHTAHLTIQLAVNASNPGDTILVCPGVYPEQVTIAKSLTIRGVASGNENLVLIRPGAITVTNSTSFSTGNPIAAIVLVKETKGVTLTNLTIDGADNVLGGCGPNLVGIYYRNASGKVEAAAVRNIRLGPGPGFEGCQAGIGIFAQSGTGPGSPSKLTVLGSSVHDYQKGGIVGNEAGTELTAIGNGVAGDGPTPFIAQNGIQIGFGATGTISFNSVVNQVYSPCVDVLTCSNGSSTAVLIYDADSVNVTSNSVAKSQSGIYLFQSDHSEVTLNIVSDTDVFDGIAVQQANNNRVQSNLIFNSDESGVYVEGNNNKVQNNTINDTPCGIFEASGTGNNLSGNFFFNTQQKKCAAAVTPLSLLSAAVATDTQRAQPVR